MTKKEKAQLIQKILNRLYPHPKIPLKYTSNYTLLIAVLLSAQATDAKVNEISPHLFAKAKTPKAMLKLTIPQIERIIRPIGLSKAKSKAIWHLSKQLIENHGGRVPDTLEELEKLPGVGHKTASAVLIHAFHKPAFPVDTHIHRCAKRWGLSSGASVKKTEEDLKKLFPKRSWAKLHLQIIYCGREHCSSRGHKKTECPVCSCI